jgi:hypothetical protein
LQKKSEWKRIKKINIDKIKKMDHDNRLKIKLDYKTTIIIGSMDAFKI